MEKVVIIQDQTGSFSRDMDNIYNSQMKTPEINNMLTEMKRDFNGLISGCYTVKERIRKPEVRQYKLYKLKGKEKYE